MNRPEYLSKYLFDWEMLSVVVGGRSSLDSRYFLGNFKSKDEVYEFLKGYGIDISDPVSRAELFGQFQEAIQFIKRYFLKEGYSDGVDLKIPNSIYMITDVSDLFMKATRRKNSDVEEMLWAEVILKVMHTILHADKDLRSGYFSVIQTQIFDRFYKYIFRENDTSLFLGLKGSIEKIPLVEFETKSKKSRDSLIIKLLHKAENVAEDIFDRVGVRFVTHNKFDALRVVGFLINKSIIIPHNIKPSRSINKLVDLDNFKTEYAKLLKKSMRESWSEDKFKSEIERMLHKMDLENSEVAAKNPHSASSYASIQFTGRQLIQYKNPFFQEFNEIRSLAKEQIGTNEIAQKIINIDFSNVSKEIRFFYPFEVQVVDFESHKSNSEGEASHQEYKKSQINSAMRRLFKRLLELKGNDTALK